MKRQRLYGGKKGKGRQKKRWECDGEWYEEVGSKWRKAEDRVKGKGSVTDSK